MALASSRWRSRPPVQDYLASCLGEFLGTFTFLLTAFCATQIANTPSSATAKHAGPSMPNLMWIALAFGISLAVNCWIFFRISGGHLNPAVSLGMAIIGSTPPLRCCVMFVSQICAGIVAAAVAKGLVPGHQVLFNVSMGGGTSVVQGLFLEMFLTAQLVMAAFFLAVEKQESNFLSPIGIGLSLFVAHLGGVYFTGCGVNPARSFGPNVVGPSFPSYHWIYWVGPFLGSLLASGVYSMLKHVSCWEVTRDESKPHDAEVGHV